MRVEERSRGRAIGEAAGAAHAHERFGRESEAHLNGEERVEGRLRKVLLERDFLERLLRKVIFERDFLQREFLERAGWVEGRSGHTRSGLLMPQPIRSTTNNTDAATNTIDY